MGVNFSKGITGVILREEESQKNSGSGSGAIGRF